MKPNEKIQIAFGTPMYIGKIDYDFKFPKKDFENNVLQLDLPHLEFKILDCCKEIVKEVGFVEQPMKINELWLNKYDKNRTHIPMHYHQNCSWTGTYYPKQATHLVQFANPNSGFQNQYLPEVKFSTDFNSDYLSFHDMQEGMVIIHPSWIAHAVYWDSNCEPSYSISFDIAYTGEIGNKNYGSYNDGK